MCRLSQDLRQSGHELSQSECCSPPQRSATPPRICSSTAYRRSGLASSTAYPAPFSRVSATYTHAVRESPFMRGCRPTVSLSLIHISEPTRQAEISYAVFCLKKK